MGKAIGLFGCTAVVAAALWLTNARQPTSTAIAQEEFDPRIGAPLPATGPRASAIELLQRGTGLYYEGRFAEAVQVLEAAREVQHQLTGTQRRRLVEHLQLARNELRGPAGSPEHDAPPPTAEAARARIDDAMRKARLEHQGGNSVQAIRWAATADSIARSAGITFPPGRETPGDFIARLRGAATSPIEPVQFSQVPARSDQLPSIEPGPDSAYPLPPEAREARRLMAQARAALNEGRYEQARSFAHQADSLNVAWSLFEDTPTQLLADVERSTGLIRFARGAAPADSGQPVAHSPAPGGDSHRTRALELLREARQDLASGRFDAARAKAAAADRLHVVYQMFDDRPEIVLQDIERSAARSSHVARRDGLPATDPAHAVDRDGPAKEQARSLLSQARRALQEGRFDDARRFVFEAEQLPVEYGGFEDNPAQVAQAIDQFDRPRDVPQNMAFHEQQPIRPVPVERSEAGFHRAAPPLAQAEDVRPAVGTHDARWQTPLRAGGAEYAPADLDVIRPRGPGAAELFNQGLAHLRQGREDLAYQAFLAAYESGQQLDPHRTQQLRDFLRELRPRRPQQQLADAGSPGTRLAGPGGREPAPALHAVEQQRAIQYDRLRSETLNAIFKADRLREKDPQQALEILDRAAASIGSSGFDGESVAPLLSQLRRTRQSVEAWQNQMAPLEDLKRHNDETLARVRQDRETEIRIEQDLAGLVDKYNELFNQRRFAEAEVVAKQARDLDSNNPVTEVMFWKARYARRVDSNNNLRERKDEGIWAMLDSAEQAAVPFNKDIEFPKDWAEINKRRKGRYGPDTRVRTEEEQQIEQSLSRRISLSFEKAPLSQVMKHVAAIANVNVAIDKQGLEEEGVPSDQEVTIHVDGIMLKSALNLMLKPLNLGYTIEDEVLKVTSRMRQQGRLEVRNYTVADLVTPIPNFAPTGSLGMTSSGAAHNGFSLGNFHPAAAPGAGPAPGAQWQVPDPALPGAPGHNPWSMPGTRAEVGGGGMSVDFDTLMELIISTIEPDTWSEYGGPGSIRPFETTLSLVIRQTQAVHDEIADLLQQLRRLQDLQVTIEVRFISVADRFFESIGIDFDFNVQDNVDARQDAGLPPFGAPGGPGVTGDRTFQGVPAPTAQGPFFNPVPGLWLPPSDHWPKQGTIVGLSQPGEFTPDLDIAFRQGSFDIGVPDFGNFDAAAGLQVGMAILTDIEAFFFIRAAQGDERTNIMFAPKVTLFNGQLASVTDNVQRPFVTSVIPTVGFFAVGFTPQITVLQEGVQLSVLAVISADRRFVRLTVIPFFSSITDVFTFSFVSQGQQGVQGIGQQAQAGGGGGFQPITGFGGIGGGDMARNALMLALPNQVAGQQQQAQQQQAQLGFGNVTIQQPVFEFVSVTTTVSVPDGGTVLLGGVKRLREGRSMAGVPILNKLPYISRLFKNTGVGRDTESLMLMVTPRIIIHEEEEELLGIPIQ